MRRLVFAVTFSILAFISNAVAEEDYLLGEEGAEWVRELFPLPLPSTQTQILGIAEGAEIIDRGLEAGPSGTGFYNRSFVFDGLTIRALVSQDEGAAYIYEIEITSPTWKLSNGISVGDPASALDGIPYPGSGGDNRFCGEADQCVEFEIDDGRVRSILIQLYIG